MEINLSLEKNRNQKAVNKDFYQTLELEQTSRVIPIDNISKTVNTYQVFDDERNKCTKYRLNVTVNPITTNVLVNPLTQIFNSNGVEIIGNNRLNAIQTINTGYTYLPGYDIFDNHFLRVNTFKTGNTLNNFTGTTLLDVMTINDSIDNNLTEDNGWFGFVNKGTINDNRMFKNKQQCEKIDLFPSRDYFSFKPRVVNDTLENNWDYCITYPYKNKLDHILVTDANNINGLPIVRGSTGYTVEIGNYLQISTPYKHGLNQGDVIKFKSISGETNTYLVFDIGDINRLDKEHTILIDIDKYGKTLTPTLINNIKQKRIIKVIDGVESNYYIRMFRKLPNFKFETEEINDENIISKTESNTVELSNDSYQLGFARNIFGDKLQQIQYIDDIDINLLTDNLNRPVSEIYFTTIKKGIAATSTEHSNVFTKIQSGIDELPNVTGYTNIRLINGNNTTEIPIENDVIISGGSLANEGGSILAEDGDILLMEDGSNSLLEGYSNNLFAGDIVEYNKTLVKENVLDVVQHRFNTVQREITNNKFIYNDIDVNLIINSITIGENWGTDHYSTVSFPVIAGQKMVQITSIVTNGNAWNYWGVNFEVGKTYTFSVTSYGTTPFTIDVGNQSFSFAGGTIANPYLNISATFTFSFETYHVIYIVIPTIGNNTCFYNFKVEQNTVATPWLPNPNDVNGNYKFGNKTIDLLPRNEGYFYKPHYKIPLKNYSEIITQGELIEITPCDLFISGVTFSDTVVLLNNSTENQIKQLILKITNINQFQDFDRLRISKLDSNNNIIDHTTTNIRLNQKLSDCILIPYTIEFFGILADVNKNTYTFKKYYSELIPSYGDDLGNGKILWREILPEGIFDSESQYKTEKKFTNGRLYLNLPVNLYLRRQDSYGDYGLKSRTFPSDPYGNSSTEFINNNKIEKINEIC